jgi:hypothetical protein
MARTHVRLLGPCFKTGQRDRRPTCNRDAGRVSKHACYTSRLRYPSVAETGDRGLPPLEQQTSPRSSFRNQRFVAQSAGEVQPSTRPTTTGRPHGSHPQQPPRRKPESPTPTSRVPPFTTTQFHVLLNSLFKVLFNFPSRYLFAIGLGVIFSLTWSLPRTLSCTPKQLDSRGKPAQHNSRLTGLSPSMGCGPSQGGLGLAVVPRGGSPKHHIPRDRDGRRFGAGLCPFHSPLLRASQLFSFPPLINMLKFGGSPCLLSGRKMSLSAGLSSHQRGEETPFPKLHPTKVFKVSDRGVSREEFFQRVSPLEKRHFKSRVLGQRTLGLPPVWEKKPRRGDGGPMPFLSSLKKR